MLKPTLYRFIQHERQPLLYRANSLEFARFVMPQIKRRSTSFLIMSAAHPLTRQGLRMVGNGKDNEIL